MDRLAQDCDEAKKFSEKKLDRPIDKPKRPIGRPRKFVPHRGPDCWHDQISRKSGRKGERS
jgi:hypothetical protein